MPINLSRRPVWAWRWAMEKNSSEKWKRLLDGEQKYLDLIVPNATPANFSRDLAREVCADPPPNLHDCGLRTDEIMGLPYFVIEVKRTVYFLGQEYRDRPVVVLYAEPREMTSTHMPVVVAG